MPLTNTQIKNAKPKDKQYKLSDQGGLSLVVRTTGSKAWKYDYRLDGKRLTYTIGTYPDTPLTAARDAHRDARKLVSEGTNPTHARQQKDSSGIRFNERCKAWLDKQTLADSTRSDLAQRLEKNIYPYMNQKDLKDYTTRDLLKIITKMRTNASIWSSYSRH